MTTWSCVNPTLEEKTTTKENSQKNWKGPYRVVAKIKNEVYILEILDAILPRRGPITRAMARRLQEDWAKDAGEDPRVLMSLKVDFGSMD